MKQRLGLAAALLCDPPVLVLDEPGNGLDPQGIRTLRNLLRSRAAKGNTVFVSSHLLGEVEQPGRQQLTALSSLIDAITAGGKVDAPVVQRIFWVVIEGVVAVAEVGTEEIFPET